MSALICHLKIADYHGNSRRIVVDHPQRNCDVTERRGDREDNDVMQVDGGAEEPRDYEDDVWRLWSFFDEWRQ